MGLFGRSNAHAVSLDHEDISQSHDDHLQFQVFQVFTCDKWINGGNYWNLLMLRLRVVTLVVTLVILILTTHGTRSRTRYQAFDLLSPRQMHAARCTGSE